MKFLSYFKGKFMIHKGKCVLCLSLLHVGTKSISIVIYSVIRVNVDGSHALVLQQSFGNHAPVLLRLP